MLDRMGVSRRAPCIRPSPEEPPYPRAGSATLHLTYLEILFCNGGHSYLIPRCGLVNYGIKSLCIYENFLLWSLIMRGNGREAEISGLDVWYRSNPGLSEGGFGAV